MSGKKAKIYRLMTRDPYFPIGNTPAEAAGKYGAGVVYKVFHSVLEEVVAGNESFHHALGTVIDRCEGMKLVPALYIDNENQDAEAQLECVRESIALAIKHKLPKIVILSPETGLLVKVREIDTIPLVVETGRLAGHSLDPQNEIREEAAKGTSIIAFYVYEHDEAAIKSMIRLARRSGIKIIFNIRDQNNHERDILENVIVILKMAGENGGGVFCNYPPAVWEALKDTKAGK